LLVSKLSVVAIHGIHGNFKDTWFESSESIKQTWLSDIFPASAYNAARVIMYGYDSSLTTGTWFTLKGIYEEAQKLLEILANLRDSKMEVLIIQSNLEISLLILYNPESQTTIMLCCTRYRRYDYQGSKNLTSFTLYVLELTLDLGNDYCIQ
jgi:hypothetical protein